MFSSKMDILFVCWLVLGGLDFHQYYFACKEEISVVNMVENVYQICGKSHLMRGKLALVTRELNLVLSAAYWTRDKPVAFQSLHFGETNILYGTLTPLGLHTDLYMHENTDYHVLCHRCGKLTLFISHHKPLYFLHQPNALFGKCKKLRHQCFHMHM